MLILYGIRPCDTVQRARRALQAAGIDYVFHDFRKDGLRAEQAQSFIEALGLEVILNRRGTTWRKLSEAVREAVDENSAARLLEEHPALIKRPVWVKGDSYRVGFARADQDALLEWARDSLPGASVARP